ncbi:MAG: flagellin [Caldilineaceae bacterium]|nr:flagellin [Caldilineaceae bacterium]
MITQPVNFLKRLRDEEVGSPMVKSSVRFLKRIGAEEAGITALETAIILIAFVVVASVFAFTMLTAGTFSTERGKEAIYAGLNEVQSTMEIKGGMIAVAGTGSNTQTVDSLIFTVANALDGEPLNLTNSEAAVVVFEYRDANQRAALENGDWSVKWLGNENGNGLLEVGELAEVTVQLSGNISPSLGTNTTFVIDVKPPSGAVLNLQRTTPAWLDPVNDLK